MKPESSTKNSTHTLAPSTCNFTRMPQLIELGLRHRLLSFYGRRDRRWIHVQHLSMLRTSILSNNEGCLGAMWWNLTGSQRPYRQSAEGLSTRHDPQGEHRPHSIKMEPCLTGVVEVVSPRCTLANVLERTSLGPFRHMAFKRTQANQRSSAWGSLSEASVGMSSKKLDTVRESGTTLLNQTSGESSDCSTAAFGCRILNFLPPSTHTSANSVCEP